MKNLAIVFLLLLLACNLGAAQVTNEFEPRSWSMIEKSLNEPDPLIIASPNVDLYKAQDLKNKASSYDKSQRIGIDVAVDYNLFNSGAWTVLENGDRIWRLNIKSPEAYFMRVICDLYYLPKGAELFLSNNDKTDKLGPYTSNENQENGVLGTWVIKGDNLWLEYYEPKNVRGLGRISLEKVTHGYVDIYKSSKVGGLNDSFSCNVDVLCNPNLNSNRAKDWTTARDNHINAVGRMLVSVGNSTGYCSGTLVNNTNQDGTPYFLTANHCLGRDATNDKQPNGVGSAFGKSLAFGFQWFTNTPDCATNNNTIGPVQPVRVITGGQVKMNNDNSDMALILMNQTPPNSWDLYYAGWNNNSTTFPLTALGMHHPSGDIMKLARNDEFVGKATFNFNGNSSTQMWRINDWEYGVTEQGSSGSMLLNENDLIVGVLSAGNAACSGITDNGGFDIYGRIETNWSTGSTASVRLKDWLDPLNTGAAELAGAYRSQLLSSATVDPVLEINIYPNPSNGIFLIDAPMPVSYEVYNLNGQLIIPSIDGTTSNQVDLTNAADGMYFVKIITPSQIVTRKVIKQ